METNLRWKTRTVQNMHTDYNTRKAKRRWVTSGNHKEEAGPEADHEGGEEITIRTQ